MALASAALIAWASWWFVRPAGLLHLADEGYIHAVALRLLDGDMLPYVDGVGHRGPLLYWVAALGAGLCGRWDWLSVRLLAAGAMVLTTLGVFLAARAARRPFAGAVAAVAVAFVGLVVMYPADGMSYNGEYLLDVFAVGGLLCAAQGLGREQDAPRLGWVAMAGACAATGALAKQNGVVLVPTLGVWVLAAAASRDGLTGRQRLRLLGAFAGGVLVPWLLVLARYAAADRLAELYYYAITYNVDVYMQTMTGELKEATLWHWLTGRAVLFASAALLVLWGLRGPLAGAPGGVLRRWNAAGFAPTVALGALLSIIACNTTLRGFWHYYLQLVPWLGLLLGLLLDGAMTRRSRAPRRAALERLLVVAPLLAVTALHWASRRESYQQAQQAIRRNAAAVCQLVAARSGPTDPLFVWGFRPDLYTWCRRLPASRFVYTTFVSGFVPWNDAMSRAAEDRFATPGARELLVHELEGARPPIIIDAPASLAGRSMLRYEHLAAYLEQHYCPGGAWRDLAFWLRRGPDGTCPPALESSP